jgi:hypothetical protein
MATGRMRNPVATFMEDFNRPVTVPDKKKRSKNGHTKHKKQQTNDPE